MFSFGYQNFPRNEVDLRVRLLRLGRKYSNEIDCFINLMITLSAILSHLFRSKSPCTTKYQVWLFGVGGRSFWSCVHYTIITLTDDVQLRLQYSGMRALSKSLEEVFQVLGNEFEYNTEVLVDHLFVIIEVISDFMTL
jgi:hypothetical protein